MIGLRTPADNLIALHQRHCLEIKIGLALPTTSRASFQTEFHTPRILIAELARADAGDIRTNIVGVTTGREIM